MKLLFVNAIDYTRTIETVYPPLGLAYLASSLRRSFPAIEVRIIDRDVEQVLASFAPDAVGVSSVSQNFGRAIEIAALCKKAGLPVFVGGVHITLLPESLPAEFDFGVYGEAEESIVEIVTRLLADPGLKEPRKLEEIRGLVVHSQTGPRLTGPRSMITDLDSLPMPDRSLLNIPAGETTYLFTSRGCPYKCAFCASTRFWDKVRWFSPEYVVAEIEQILENYNPRALSFYDDLFIANLPRLERIVALICAKGIHKRVKFSFACRANLVNEKLLKILAPLDILMICMGLESGAKRTLEYLKGESASPAQNMRAVELLAGTGINVQGTFIIGSPEETEEEILETLAFIKASKLSNFDVYILTPFPGTPVWDVALKRGLVSNRMDWGKLAVDPQDPEARIILSAVPKARLFELYALFSREKKKRRLKYILRTGLRNPLLVLSKIQGLLLKKFSGPAQAKPGTVRPAK